MVSRDKTRLNRRRLIKYGGAAGISALVAGCVGGDDDDSGDENGGDGGNGGDNGADNGTATNGSDVDQVTIGSNHPLTGDLSGTGERMDMAVQLAADIKNENGGIESLGGAEVEVISGDNEGAQELGGEVAQNLIDDGADVLTGCFSSPVTSAATRVAEQEQTPFVISVSVANSILQETQLNYVYRPQPSARQMGVDHARLMPEVARNGGLSVDTAGLFYIDISFGQSVRDTLKEELPKHDVEVVEEAAIGFGETADTQVTQMRDADPDAVIGTTYQAGTVELVKAMDNQEYRPPVLAGCANAALNDVGSLEEMGGTANGALATNFALDPTLDRAGEVNSRFTEEFDRAFDANVAMTYASTEVIIAAIEEAGSADADDINDTLANITVEDHIAAMPPVTFRDDGENENALAPLFQVQELEDRVVSPEEFAETEPQF